MYNNQFMYPYNPQVNIDRINNQINELEKIKNQLQQPQTQPTNLTQNFQLASTSRDIIRYASSIDEVQKDMVIGDTPYFSKDMSVVWIKNIKGEIKTYELNEIVPKDDRDLQIEFLMTQIDELKGKIENEQHYANDEDDVSTESESDTKWDDEKTRTTTKNEKPTGISRISTSKKK